MNASDIKQVLASLAECFDVEKERLGDLDATLGDGDHGISMASGFAKAHEAIKEKDIDDAGSLLQLAGRALLSGIGGASGPLFAMLLLELGKASAGSELDLTAFKTGVRGAAEAVQRLGKAEVGDKTMLDVLFPVSDAIQDANNLGEALELAANTATSAAQQTADLAAKKGRAQYVQGGGLGHPDPGSVSLSIVFQAFHDVYKEVG